LAYYASRGIETDLSLTFSDDRDGIKRENNTRSVSSISLRGKYDCSTLSDILTSCWYADTYSREEVGIGYGRYSVHDSRECHLIHTDSNGISDDK
jgi:hypothetical protein